MNFHWRFLVLWQVKDAVPKAELRGAGGVSIFWTNPSSGFERFLKHWYASVDVVTTRIPRILDASRTWWREFLEETTIGIWKAPTHQSYHFACFLHFLCDLFIEPKSWVDNHFKVFLLEDMLKFCSINALSLSMPCALAHGNFQDEIVAATPGPVYHRINIRLRTDWVFLACYGFRINTTMF